MQHLRTIRIPLTVSAAGLCGAILAALLLAVPACDSVQIVIDPSEDTNSDVPQPVPEEPLVVRLANTTAVAVDAQVYVSTNAFDNTADTLFVEENLFSEGIGLAATGLLAPTTTDIAEMACTTGFVLGTAGGSFRDPETGAELGKGTPRILQQGLVFDCNAQITFMYSLEDGVYSVYMALE